MHHVVLERWSRGESWPHRRDARFKLAGAVVFLILIGSAASAWAVYVVAVAALMAGTIAARLPLAGVMKRAGLVLPFAAMFAATTWFAGDAVRAAGILAKTYLSAWTALWLAGCTPLPQLLRAAEWFGVPKVLILVIQFLYRYLFVLSEQGQHMRLAASCRAGSTSLALVRRAAGGALAVLFARSYQRAAGIHQAMQSRGFNGAFPFVQLGVPDWRDALFFAATVGPVAAVRWL